MIEKDDLIRAIKDLKRRDLPDRMIAWRSGGHMHTSLNECCKGVKLNDLLTEFGEKDASQKDLPGRQI